MLQVVKKSGALIPYPAIKERKPDILQGPYDTDPVDALEVNMMMVLSQLLVSTLCVEEVYLAQKLLHWKNGMVFYAYYHITIPALSCPSHHYHHDSYLLSQQTFSGFDIDGNELTT